MMEPHDLPRKDIDEIGDEAPPDALPASPGLRRLAIVIYVMIVVCVVLALLLGMIWGGISADRFGFPLPESWSI
jgi:hypothetical protein